MRTSAWVRGAGALLLTAFQLGAASADAVLDAERVGLLLHVEAPDSEHCAEGHDHLFCQLVRSLAAVSTPKAGGSLPLPAPTLDDGSPGVRLDAHTRPDRGGPTAPRPPPLG